MVRRAAKGEPLNISASTWNKVTDLVGESNGLNPGDGSFGTSPLGTGWIMAKNNTANDRDRYDCMAIDSPAIALTTAAREDLVFNLIAAASDKPAAVLLEPIAAGKYGRVAINGLTLAKVAASSSTSNKYASPSSSGNNLAPASTGTVKLLDTPSTSTVKLMPVLLNSPSSSSASNPLAYWQFNPHSSTAAGFYSNFGDTFGTELVSAKGDFRALGIDLVTDSDVSTASCVNMRFNLAGSYLLTFYMPVDCTSTYAAAGIDDILINGDFELDFSRMSTPDLQLAVNQRKRITHPGPYTAVTFDIALHIAAALVLKINLNARGLGRPNGSATSGYMNFSTAVSYNKTSWDNGRITIRKFDTMPTAVYYP